MPNLTFCQCFHVTYMKSTYHECLKCCWLIIIRSEFPCLALWRKVVDCTVQKYRKTLSCFYKRTLKQTNINYGVFFVCVSKIQLNHDSIFKAWEYEIWKYAVESEFKIHNWSFFVYKSFYFFTYIIITSIAFFFF